MRWLTTTDVCRRSRIAFAGHPAYPKDVTALDVLHYCELKETLWGKQSSTENELLRGVGNAVKRTTKAQDCHCSGEPFVRMGECVAVGDVCFQ
jgi:hypothetical protein